MTSLFSLSGRSRACIALFLFLLIVPCSLAASDPGARASSAIAEEDWEGVLTATADGLAAEPDNISLLCMKGYALRKLGHYDEAAAAVSQAIALDQNPSATRTAATPTSRWGTTLLRSPMRRPRSSSTLRTPRAWE